MQGGELVGLNIQGPAALTPCAFGTGQPGDIMRYRLDDPPPGTNQPYPSAATGLRADVSASVEPDADRDGFGDETQDGCPTDASTQGACPATGQRARARRTCRRKYRRDVRRVGRRVAKRTLRRADRLPV